MTRFLRLLGSYLMTAAVSMAVAAVLATLYGAIRLGSELQSLAAFGALVLGLAAAAFLAFKRLASEPLGAPADGWKLHH